MAALVQWTPLVAFASILLLGGGQSIALARRGLRPWSGASQRGRGEKRLQAWRSLLVFAWLVAALAEAGLLPGPLFAALLGGRLWEGGLVAALGVLLLCVSVALYGAGLKALGASWRLGTDQSTPGRLVTTGPFAWSRNPLFLAFDLLLLGAFLATGRWLFLALGGAIAGVLHLLILEEEQFLAAAHGEAYARYRASVGRYWGRRRP